MAERVGFEPTVPFDITGFQDRLLKPLGHLSLNAQIITKSLHNVNENTGDNKNFLRARLEDCAIKL